MTNEAATGWQLEEYATSRGELVIQSFLAELTPADREEALTLLNAVRTQGNTLRRPASGFLGDGLFELRGTQVRIFYCFRPGRRIVLLDGFVKKRTDIPEQVLKRVRQRMKEV